MQLGITQALIANRASDHGCYLIDEQGEEVLLPNKYVPSNLNLGDTIEVFVYKDHEERPVATTLVPMLELHQFAYLETKEVTEHGAFMDWGLTKQLFVPFSEQKDEFKVGRAYLIYLNLDEKTDRLYGSNIERKFVEEDVIDLRDRQKVKILPYLHTDLGINAIIEHKYKGLIFESDIHKNVTIGEWTEGYVKEIRDDKKINLTLEPYGYFRTVDKNANIILAALEKNEGELMLHDKSDPLLIKQELGLSKKAFKKGVGFLFKNKQIKLLRDRIVIA